MPSFLDNLPEVFVSNSKISAQVNQAIKQRKLRKIGSRLYTKNMTSSPEDIVKRNWYSLLKDYYPDALIADRTAIENKPAEDGSIFIISSKKRQTEIPGIIFKPRPGAAALDTDKSFLGDVRLSSMPRAYLENMRISRARAGKVPRTLSKIEIEERLDKIIRQGGEDAINQIRDEARRIASSLGMQEEFKKLDELIGSLLGTRESLLESNIGKARKKCQPYDPERLELFLKLFEALKNTAPVRRSATSMNDSAKSNLSFFEAYFSNFIEGTEFEIDEATDIVFGGNIPQEKPEDAHDILGTFRVVSDYSGMALLPKTTKGFFHILKTRHKAFMELRTDKNPGQFKTKRNQAGSTHFVEPDLVTGTLEKGFDIYQGLEVPLQRAIFMMFLISEVHPFTDGNGRAARIMMNAELVAAKEQKIIIPAIYRRDYLSALKAITQSKTSDPLIRMLDFAQKYTQSIDWNDFKIAQQQLTETHAFIDPIDAEDKNIRLKIWKQNETN